MKKLTAILLLATGTLLFVSSSAQQAEIDSLENLLKTAEEDTTKVNIMNQLFTSFSTYNYDEALKYAIEAEQLAKTAGFEKGRAQAINNQGIISFYQGDYPAALEKYNDALEIREQERDKKGIADSYHNMGVIHYYQGNYEKALDYLNKSLELREEINDKQGMANSYNFMGAILSARAIYDEALKSYQRSLEITKELNNEGEIAGVYQNIGNIYVHKGQYSQASEHYFNALKIADKTNNLHSKANVLSNLGNVFYYQNNYTKALELYEQALETRKLIDDKHGMGISYEAIAIIYHEQKDYSTTLDYYKKSLEIREEIGDKKGIGGLYNNIGDLYKAQENNSKALTYYFKSLEIHKELEDKLGTAEALNNISIIFSRQNDHRQAIKYQTKGLAIAKEIGAIKIIADGYKNLADAYSKSNNYKKAAEYLRFYASLKDTLFNEQSSKQIAEMQTKYETEKKVKEIELLKKENEIKDLAVSKQKLLRNSFIVGLALALALALLLYNRYRIKQKANALLEEQNQFISQQNEEINVQKEQLEDSNQRLEKRNKQITDSINYASRIQQSILPSDEFISKLLLDSFILFKPRDIVSGDFYWFSKKNNKILLAAVDCTGHGVPGAFMSMIGNTLLNEIVNEKGITKPSDILAELNTGIKKALHQNGQETHSDDGMDLSLVSIDPEKRRLSFAGAKRPLYIASNGVLNEIKGNPHGIGGGRKKIIKKFTPHGYTLKKGDTFYFFSDGYIDQFGGEEDEKFMIERFEKLLLDINHLTMKEQYSSLENSFEKWKGSGKQIDDVLVIGVRV